MDPHGKRMHTSSIYTRLGSYILVPLQWILGHQLLAVDTGRNNSVDGIQRWFDTADAHDHNTCVDADA